MVDEDPLVDEVPVKRKTGSSQKKKKARREADFFWVSCPFGKVSNAFSNSKIIENGFKNLKIFSRASSEIDFKILLQARWDMENTPPPPPPYWGPLKSLVSPHGDKV